MIDRTLPFIDLHRHLDGNVRLETILELADRHQIDLPAKDVEGLRPHVQISERESGLMAFISRFKYLTAILVDGEACRRVGYENVADARAEGIDYLELRFSPWFMAESHGLDPRALIEAVVDGVRAGERDTGVKAQLIGILSRTYGPETCMRELDALLAFRDEFVALDLAGDEARFPAPLFRAHFERARDAGLAVTVHAGEAAGPQSIWESIRELGATRIGHGLSAREDPALLDFLAERRIGLEVSLTSNVHTSAVTGYEEHPLAEFLRRGLLANLNTDDPAISGIDLTHEYTMAAPRAGLSPAQIRQSQANALEMAFLSAADKKALAERKRSTPRT